MSPEFYKVLHICGILLLFSGLTALVGLYVSGKAPDKSLRVALSSVHGVGILLVLISGMGMAAKLGYLHSFPTWLITKMGIWLVLAGSGALAKKKAQWGVSLIVFWVALGTLAAYLAVFKPI